MNCRVQTLPNATTDLQQAGAPAIAAKYEIAEEVMNYTPNVRFLKNQTIFEEDYLPDAVYLICEGAVEVFRNRAGKRISLAHLAKGAIFGEMALISDQPRSATVIALTEDWCYAVNKRTFVEKLKNVPPEVRDIFDALVTSIRQKSNDAVIIDHGRIRPVQEPMPGAEALAQSEANGSGAVSHVVLHGPALQEQIDRLDLFMGLLLNNLVKIAH